MRVILALLACRPPEVAPPESPLRSLQWLNGGWTESYLGEAVATEHWWYAGDTLHGVNFVVQDGRTRGFEVMCIETVDGVTRFRANPPSQSEGRFPAVVAESARMRFENTAHDYPTSIEYVRTREGLHAAIAGPAGANPYAWDFVVLPSETAPLLESADRAFEEAARLERGAAWRAMSDASAQLAGGARIVGPEAIGAEMGEAYADGRSMRWTPEASGLSSAGDVGFTAGTWSRLSGRKVTGRGTYLTVWRKQADGTWRLAMRDESPPPR